MEELENYYFISCRNEGKRFSELEQLLQSYKDENKLQIQYSFPYIATVAVILEEKGIIDELKDKGYSIEPQHVLRKLYPEES
jgi:hypothetical protein